MRTVAASLVFCFACIAAGAGEPIKVGAEAVLLEDGPGKGTQATPHVAWGKDAYLAVWREGWHGKSGSARIYAARVDRDGKALDARGIGVAPAGAGVQTMPRVAYAASTRSGQGVFLVVWQDFRNERDYDVLGARVSAEGKVLDVEPLRIAAGPRSQVLPDVASDGEAFVVVWQGMPATGTSYQGFAARVEPDGRVGEPVPTGGAPQPQIAWSGNAYLVVFGGFGLNSLRLDAAAKMLEPNRKPWDGPVVRGTKEAVFSVSAAPGKGWLVVSHRSPPDPWGWGGPGAMRCFLMLPDGKLDSEIKPEPSGNWDKLPNWLDVGGRERKTWPHGGNASAWDGEQFVVVWQRHHITGEKKSNFENCDLMASRVDGWKPLDPAGIAIAAGPEEEMNPALASDGAGGLLCVYEKYGADRRVRIIARRLTTR